MAVVKYGSLITNVKGKLNGSILQGGNRCNVLRNGIFGLNGLKNQSFSNVNNVNTCASAWKLLTDAERSAWQGLVPSWLFYDKFGNKYNASAFQVFVALNVNRLLTGNALLSSPPLVRMPTYPGIISVSYSIASGLILTWGNNTNSGDVMWVYGTNAVSQGRNNFSGVFRRFATFYSNGQSPMDLTAQYEARRTMPVVGQKINFKITCSASEWTYQYYEQHISCVYVD